MRNWTTGQKVRRGLLAALLLFFLIIAHAGGVFIDIGILFVYGAARLGPAIYRHGHRRIAEGTARAILDEQERRNQES
jgi:hypothetical protein